MKTENLNIFIDKMAQENERKINAEKRKKHFQEIGRKGGLKMKIEPQLSKVISFRLSVLEYEESLEKARKFNLKLSTYSRMIHLGKELKINEFRIDEILLKYLNNSKKITNLMRHREWNMFENKKEILAKIETTNDLMYQYLYSKMNERNKQ